jgi:hypothetical protein
MSGRIRSIKPELLDDAVTAGLSDMAFRVFIATIVLADDYGRLRAEPGWLMGQIFWARTVHVDAFLEAMKELGPLVRFYVVNGQRYAEIRNWSKHQKVSHPGKPRVPPPEILAKPSGEPHENDTAPASSRQRVETTDPPKSSGESPETLVPDLRSPIPITDPDHTAPQLALAVPPEALPSETKTKRGTRLPDGWRPSSETQAWARKQGVADPCGSLLEEFTDFWRGIPGARGVKLDWDATYRNRVRQTATAGGSRRAPIVQSADNRAWKMPEEMP